MTPQEKLAQWLQQKGALVAKLEANLSSVPADMMEAQESVISILKANMEALKATMETDETPQA